MQLFLFVSPSLLFRPDLEPRKAVFGQQLCADNSLKYFFDLSGFFFNPFFESSPLSFPYFIRD